MTGNTNRITPSLWLISRSYQLHLPILPESTFPLISTSNILIQGPCHPCSDQSSPTGSASIFFIILWNTVRSIRLIQQFLSIFPCNSFFKKLLKSESLAMLISYSKCSNDSFLSPPPTHLISHSLYLYGSICSFPINSVFTLPIIFCNTSYCFLF